LLKSLDSTARREQTPKPSAPLAIALAFFVTLIATSGVLLLLDENSGVYLYVVSAIGGLVTGVHGWWLFLTQAGMMGTTVTEDA